MALSRSLREIERKFTFSRQLLPILRSNGGQPPFQNLTPFKQFTIHDAYFDNPTRVLSKNPTHPIWLRKRDMKWQAKVTKSGSGDYKRVVYDEIRDLAQIEDLVRKHLPRCPGPDENFGLKPFCEYITDRTEFTADERYSVALDTTDFGHDVGEVEVSVPVDDREESGQVMREIEEFMEKYRWIFKSGKGEPKGKMSAYFERFGGW